MAGKPCSRLVSVAKCERTWSPPWVRRLVRRSRWMTRCFGNPGRLTTPDLWNATAQKITSAYIPDSNKIFSHQSASSQTRFGEQGCNAGRPGSSGSGGNHEGEMKGDMTGDKTGRQGGSGSDGGVFSTNPFSTFSMLFCALAPSFSHLFGTWRKNLNIRGLPASHSSFCLLNAFRLSNHIFT